MLFTIAALFMQGVVFYTMQLYYLIFRGPKCYCNLSPVEE